MSYANLKEILTTYWSQVVLLLAGLGYFEKLFLTTELKREINHSLFQQNKISAGNKFFLNYANAELMWNDFPIYEVLNGKLTAKDWI